MRNDATLQILQRALSERYEVLERVGGGGMADVYLARHRVHGGFNAIKVLSDRLSEERALVEAFLQEARTAATLQDHPNIVQILDVDAAEGLYFLVMQYVPGEDLSRYLSRKGALSPEETAYVISETAKALDWAHQRHVVHRDIKPGNIRLTPTGRVIVMDFGISKVGRMPSAMTSVGLRGGTPHYMSPEQFAGGAIDARSDIYSLGVMAYECLAGCLPFEGETEQEIALAHRTQTQEALKRLPPGTPRAFVDLIYSMMQPAPENRIATAGEVAAQLAPFTGNKPPELFSPEATVRLDYYREQPTTAPLNKTLPGYASEPEPAAEPPAAAEAVPDAAQSKTPWVLMIAGVLLLLGAAAYFVLPSPNPGQGGAGKAASPGGGAGPALFVDNPAGDMLFVPRGAASGARAFYIDLHEVTSAAYQTFSKQTGRPMPEPPADQPDYFVRPELPMINVLYADADAFCDWAGKRLPSEAEWIQAAGGEDGRPYPWGQRLPGGELANVQGDEDGYANQSPVGVFLAGVSPVGALDMVGNVWELTATSYEPSASERAEWSVIPGAADSAWTVIKGGAYDRPAVDIDFRLDTRRGIPASHHFRTIGFRCASSAPSP